MWKRQVPNAKQFDEWVKKTADLFMRENHEFRPHGAAAYTVTEVVLKALESLAKEEDELVKEEGIKKNKKA